LERLADYNKFTQEVIQAISYGEYIKNQWLWKDGKPLNEPEKFILAKVQTYIMQLFDAGGNEIGNMRKIALVVLHYYPDNVASLSDLAMTYIAEKKFDTALRYLWAAEKLDPQNYTVLNNIAYCYSQKGDKDKAIKYYELVKKYGPDRAKADAERKIKAFEQALIELL